MKYNFKLILPPIIIILFVAVITLFFNNWQFSRAGYWQMQSDCFIYLNATLVSILPTQVWLNITQLGDALVFMLILSFLTIVQPKIWAALFGTIPLAAILSVAGKNIATIPRPATVLDNSIFTIVGDTITASTSLPSGHSITIATIIITILICLNANKYKVILGSLLIVILCISRVAVGAHWPLDLLLGIAFGYLSAISGVTLMQRYKAWWKWSVGYYGLLAQAIILLLWSWYIFIKNDSFVTYLSIFCGTTTALILLYKFKCKNTQ